MTALSDIEQRLDAVVHTVVPSRDRTSVDPGAVEECYRLLAPTVHALEVPPTVISLGAEKPLTASLNVTEQLRVVWFVVPAAGTQENAVTDGVDVSIV